MEVAPYVGAWIETEKRLCKTLCDMSHPTWVRGLKLEGGSAVLLRLVAPYVGAWIETEEQP